MLKLSIFPFRILSRLSLDEHESVPTEDVYLTYQLESCASEVTLIGKQHFTTLVSTLFKGVHVKNKSNTASDSGFCRVCQGLKLNDINPYGDKFSFDPESLSKALPSNYYITQCLPDKVCLSSQTEHYCNGVNIAKLL